MKIYKVKVNGKLYEVELEAVTETDGKIETEPKKTTVPSEITATEGKTEIVTPIAGKVLDIKVKVGDTVKKGQTVAVVEAMKLENEVPSTSDGTVAEIKVQKGAQVGSRDVLIVLG